MMIRFEATKGGDAELASGHLPCTVEPNDEGNGKSASALKLATLCILVAVGVAALSALGIWQLERRVWKLDLIERVNARVHSPPEAAPGPSSWRRINAANDAYRHILVSGRFLDDPETRVRAVTERGAGYWILAPFRTVDGFTVMVNRGFVPADRVDDVARRAVSGREIALTGLLRITEPGGGFLRHNDPAADRWYSRDVAAIAAARGIGGELAPYFIDADAYEDPSTLPIGGLTVIAFPNNHLVYALTWFGLALMLAGWSFHFARQEWCLRRRGPGSEAYELRMHPH